MNTSFSSIAPRFGRVIIDTESFAKVMPQSDGNRLNTVENRTKEFEAAKLELSSLTEALDEQGYDVTIKAHLDGSSTSGFSFAFDLQDRNKGRVGIQNESRGMYAGSSAVSLLSNALSEGFTYHLLDRKRLINELSTFLTEANAFIGSLETSVKAQFAKYRADQAK